MTFAKTDDIVSIDQIEIQKGNGFADFADLESCCEDCATVVKSIKANIVHAYTENECVKEKLSTINDNPTPWDFANKPTKEWINNDLMNRQEKFVKNSILKKDCG